jgi:hypothetical protein
MLHCTLQCMGPGCQKHCLTCFLPCRLSSIFGMLRKMRVFKYYYLSKVRE